jgi:hypothetical protein
MKALLTLAALAVVAALGAYYGSPYYATWRLEQAAKAGDAGTIARFVDFPAVRANLTPSLTAALAASMAVEKTRPHSWLDRIGMAVAPWLHAKPVDTLVTPEGLAVMLKTAGPPSFTSPFHQGREPDAAHPGEPFTLSQGYVHNDYDQFQAAIGNRLRPGAAVTLKLLRRGFLTWRVTNLDLITRARVGRETVQGGEETN